MPIELSRLLVQASELAREEADARFTVSPEAIELRRVARVLCEKRGHDPDIVVMGWEDVPLAVGAKRTVALLQLPIHPQWMLFVREARDAIEVLGNAQAQNG